MAGMTESSEKQGPANGVWGIVQDVKSSTIEKTAILTHNQDLLVSGAAYL